MNYIFNFVNFFLLLLILLFWWVLFIGRWRFYFLKFQKQVLIVIFFVKVSKMMLTERVFILGWTVTFLDNVIILLAKRMGDAFLIWWKLMMIVMLIFEIGIFEPVVVVWITLVLSLIILFLTMLRGGTMPVETVWRMDKGEDMKEWGYEHDGSL